MDDHVNVRPYILAICFAWGLICGFLFHTFSDSKPQSDPSANKKNKPKISQAATTPKTGTRGTTLELLEPLTPTTKEPPRMDDLLSQAPEASGTNANPSWDLSEAPEAPLALRNDWGLTGTTAVLPKTAPTLSKPGPSAPRSQRTREWTPGDDPELVF